MVPVVTTATTCVDLALPGRPSDCPANANLCQNNLYRALMQQQCPRTCGYCTVVQSTNSSCVDMNLPGRPSDCPALASLCTNAIYQSLMTQQCPRTCGLC
ncbi:unnamed protein product [Enterobius vermicularis]|uniref:ShTK domain protein n=1 Tax=Enterobius vermicularis TaxID=51028 RepID=A0A0N4V6K1_ENTVE|nr:unnamed protein product [Enterobius vermicularis]